MDPEQDVDSLSLGAKTLLFVGGLVPAGVIDLAVHGGLSGLLVGGISAYLLAQFGGDLRRALAALTGSSPSASAPSPLPAERREQPRTDPLPQASSGEPRERTLRRELSPRSNEIYVAPRPDHALLLAPGLAPDIDELLSEGVVILGDKGSGKTNLTALLCEEIARVSAHLDPLKQGVAQLVFDKEGDLLSLRDSFPNGQVMTAAAPLTALEILDRRLQVVVDLASWERPAQQAQVMVRLLSELLQLSSSIPAPLRLPCVLVLDEAQFWLPEQGAPSYLPEEEARAISDLFGVVLSTGRKRGLVLFLAGTRLAQIQKRAVAGLGVQIFMRQVMDSDQQRAAHYLGARSRELGQLGQGEGLVCFPGGPQLRVRFHERRSQHRSHTPTVERLRVMAPPLQAAEARPEPTAPQKERNRPAPPPEGESSEPSTWLLSLRLPAELQRALEVYQPGITYRELASRLGIGKDKAGALLRELRRRHLIA